MDDGNFWEEHPDSGITPGLEEALRRETEKSKALKVERLQLRNEIEFLRSENHCLLEENQRLKERPPPSDKIDTVVSNLKSEPRLAEAPFIPVSLRNGLLFLVFVIFFLFYYTFSR